MERKSVVPAVAVVFLTALLLVGESFLPGRLLLPLAPDDFPAWAEGSDPADLRRHPHPNYNMSDVLHLLVPGLAITAEARQRDVLPLWDPSQALGVPHLHQVHYGVLYPPAWLPLGLGLQGLGVLAMVHLLVAGFGMIYYLRGLGRTPMACAVGALAFMGSAWVTGRLQAFPTVGAAVWLPWVIGGLERGATGGGWRPRMVAAAALAMSFLAGFPQIALWVATLAGGIELVRALVARIKGTPALKPLLASAFALALGLLMAAPQLVPTREYLNGESLRTQGDIDQLVTQGLELPLMWHLIFPNRYAAVDVPGLHPLAVQDTEQGRLPGALNRAEVSMGIGIIGLMLAILAAMFGRSWRTRLFTLITVAVFVVLLWPPAMRLAATLLPWLKYGSPKRLLVLSTFALSVLAAGGMDLARGHRLRMTVMAWGLAIALGSLAFMTLRELPAASEDWEVDAWAVSLATSLGQQGMTAEQVYELIPKDSFIAASEHATTGCVVALVVAVLAWFVFLPRRDATVEGWKTIVRRSPGVLVVLLAGEVFLNGWPALRAVDTVSVTTQDGELGPYHVPPLVKEARSLVGNDDGPVPMRLARLGEAPFYLRPNFPSLFGLHDVQAYTPMLPRRVAELIGAIDPDMHITGSGLYGFTSPEALSRPAVDMLGLRILLTDRPDEIDGFVERAWVGRVRVLENTQALPRVFAVPFAGALAVPNAAERLELLADPDFVPHEMVLLDIESLPELSSSQWNAWRAAERAGGKQLHMVEYAIPPGRRAVTVESYLPGRMTIRVGPGAPVWLVVTETWNPGWVAHADGQTLDVLVANHAVMAVLVASTTETQLTVAFQPREVSRGFWLGGIGWIAAVVLFVLPWWPRPRAAAVMKTGLDPDDVVVPRGLRRLVLWVDMLRSAVAGLRNRESADEEPDEEPDEGPSEDSDEDSDEDSLDENEARREPGRGF